MPALDGDGLPRSDSPAQPPRPVSRNASTQFPALKRRNSTSSLSTTADAHESTRGEDTGSVSSMGASGLGTHRTARRASVASAADAMSIASADRAASPARSAASNASSSSHDEISFTLPEPCGGSLIREHNGRLRCEQDRGAQGVLDLLSELDPGATRNVQVPHGATVHIDWDADLMQHMHTFMRLADGNPLLATDLLRDAIAKGEHAFTEQARMPGSDQHPADFLRSIGIRIRVTPDNGAGAQLQSVLEAHYDDEDKNARITRFLHDFGAMSLLSLANNKTLDKQLAYGVGASLAGTATIGTAFDYGIWDHVKRAMKPADAATFGPLLDSITPLVAETFDSMVIKRLLEVMKGGNLLPADAGEAWDDFKGSAYSGTIAMFGSIANNYVRELLSEALQKGDSRAAVAGLFVAKQFTNLLATWASGAMIPLDVKANHEQLIEAKKKLIEDGLVARPEARDLQQHVRESTLNTVRAARGDGSAIRSMAAGGEISASIGLLLSVLWAKGVVPESLERLITLVYSTPTEVLSMTATVAAEKWVGADGDKADARIMTDAAKQSAMLARLAGGAPTALTDLDRIARPDGERNAALGHAVTITLATAMALIDKAIDHAGTALAGAGRALEPAAELPYVSALLRSTSSGMSGAAHFAFQHALQPLGERVQAVSGAAYAGALQPLGQRIAQAVEDWTPTLAPLGNGASAVATGIARGVVKPAANATATTVDTVARVPGMLVELGTSAAASATNTLGNVVRRRRAPRTVRPSGADQV
ncbi:hypothetical protein [Burkholderia ambifaria]|uniref:Type III effector protein n=1 Tax=Burkholderia ambifaria TaxID=152480 RepID=A0AA41JKX4_9BURK|nr:hypothetical protein [Burkholderia ambifaria]MBR8130747.1 hypothetical protein [Burkholderia ambifaria]